MKKNQMPVKWMFGIMAFVLAVVFMTHQASKTMLSSTGSKTHVGFFQFLADMLGLGGPNNSSEASRRNNMQTGSNQNSGRQGGINSPNQQNQNLSSAENGSASQESGSAQDKDNARDSDGINGLTNSKLDAAGNAEGNSESNVENNPDNNLDTGNSPGDNSEINSEGNTALNSVNPPGNNPGDNGGNNPPSNSENPSSNSDNPPGENPGGGPGSGPGTNPGYNPGNGPGDNPGGGNPGAGGNPFVNQPDLPTINPIPSNNTVSQSIARQNQQSDALAALVSSRQALVVPVQQQAQASKFQTVNPQTIPGPSTNKAPDDIEAKLKSNQISLH